NARTTDALARAAALVSQKGRCPMTCVADVTSADAVDNMVNDICAKLGHVDILVNNAARGAEPVPFYEMTEREWRSDLDTILTGSFYCAKAVRSEERRVGKECRVMMSTYG